jgi:hypothetical protein
MGALMPAFDTPEPITATIDLVQGEVRISAGERADTVVEVRPSDDTNKEDVRAAENTRVEYAGGELLIRAPKLRSWLPTNSGGSIDVTLELPAGSRLHGSGQLADFRSEGRLGDCRIKIGLGRIELDRAATLDLKSGAGDIGIEQATGHAELTAGSGDVRVRTLDSSAVIKNSNGETWVGSAVGDLRISAANGGIAVDLAGASVVAKSSNGDVRVAEVVRGAAVLETRLGDVEIGIREGTAAYLDVNATAGRVRTELETVNTPASADETVEVRARTTVGDIVVRRP